MGKMPCHISDGPQTPEDVYERPEERDEPTHEEREEWIKLRERDSAVPSGDMECPKCKEIALAKIGRTDCFDEWECFSCGYYCTTTNITQIEDADE